MTRAKGIDISKWQGTNLDWSAIRNAGFSFAFLRASSGSTEDSTYELNRERATKAGVLLGGYHYFYPQVNIPTQVELLARLVDSKVELPAVLDVEEAGLNEGLVFQFLDSYEKLTGRIPMIYTSAYKWHTLVGRNKTWAARYPLWVAHYTTAANPILPDAWKTWSFWQFTSSGSVPNYAGRIDTNWYNGTEEELKRFYAHELTLEDRVDLLESRVSVLEAQYELLSGEVIREG